METPDKIWIQRFEQPMQHHVRKYYDIIVQRYFLTSLLYSHMVTYD